MIRLCFLNETALYAGLTAKGTADTVKRLDIVCAAVSAAVELVESTVNDIAKVGAEVVVDKQKARVRLVLPDKMGKEARPVSESVLLAMYKTLSGYESEYGKYLSVSKREIGSEYQNGG